MTPKFFLLKMFAFAFGAVMLVGVFLLAIQVSDRSSPISDASVRAVPSVVEQGGTIQLDARIFYQRSCYTHVIRRLIDAKGERYALPELVLPPGALGLQHSISNLLVASDFALGEGRYVSSPSYGCNWFQRWFWPMRTSDRSAPFLVVASAKNRGSP